MDPKTLATTVALAIAGGLLGAFLGVFVIEATEEVVPQRDGWAEATVLWAQGVGMALLIGSALVLAGRSAWLHRARPLAFYVAVIVAAPFGLTVA